MIVKDGKEYYPLDFGKMVKDGKTYYDRSARQKNYFYLDLRTGERSGEQTAPEEE